MNSVTISHGLSDPKCVLSKHIANLLNLKYFPNFKRNRGDL